MSNLSADGRRGRRSRLALVIAYLGVGLLWIAYSDRLVTVLVPAELREIASMTKGFAYVLVTAVLAWLLLLARDLRLEREGAALEASERRYRMLTERSQDVIYRLGLLPELHFEYLSPAVTTVAGYTPDELYAHPPLGLDMIRPEDRAVLAKAATGADDGPVLVRWHGRNGDTIWMEHRSTVIADAEGRPIAVEGAARDVTARIVADEHRRLLTGAIEATPVGVAVISPPDAGLRLTYVNEALAGVTGIPAASLVGRSALDFLAAGGPATRRDVESRLAVGGPFEVSAALPAQGRDPTPVSVLVSPVTGADGVIQSVIAFVVDRSEAVARSRAEARLDRVLDASPAAIVVTDGDGVVTAWNPAAERIFGRTAADTVDRAMDVLPADERPRFLALQRQLAAGESVPAVEIDLLHRDGHRVPCRVQVGLIGADPSRPSGMVTVIEDLTAQRAQERSRVELASAMDAAGEAILITDLDGTITYVNPACEHVTGYDRAELLGKNPRILKSGLTSPAVYEDMWRRLTSGQAWRGVLVNRRKDGALYEEEAVFTPVTGADGAPVAFVAVKRDLTLERHLAAGLSTLLNDRAAVQEAIATVDLGETPEETAGLLSDCLAAFPEVDSVLVAHFPAVGRSAIVIGQIGVLGADRAVGEALDDGIAEYLRERAESGPWADDHVSGRVDPRIDRAEVEGVTVVGAPIRHRGRVVGALIAATSTGSADSWAARYVRVVSELAAHVGPLLGPALARRDETAAAGPHRRPSRDITAA